MLCEQGLISVVITGGEPLVYKDLPELLDYADTKGLKLQILTNGYLIDEQFVNRIKNYRNLIVQVSLDGSNSKTNNLQRNKNDAFSRTIENIKLLRSYNIEVITAMVLNKHNVGDIYDGSMIKLCEDLDVNVLAITPTVIKIENAKKNEEEFLAPYEILNVVNYINDINKTYDNKLIINVSAPPSVTYETSVSKVKKKRPRCRRGSNSFSIRPNGDICVCSDFMEVGYETYELGNIMTDDFSFLINELSKVSKRKLESINRIKGVCSICTELQYCGGACRIDRCLLDKMARAGCYGIYFGIESGSIRMQKIINKNLKLDTIHDVIDGLKITGIEPTFSFIYGFPEETEDDIESTLSLFYDLHKRYKKNFFKRETSLQLHRLRVYAGTKIHNDTIDLLYMPDDPSILIF